MRCLLLYLLLLLSACGSSERTAEEGAARGYTTLCIQNATAGYGELVARAGMTSYRVPSGDEVCKTWFIAQTQITLQARTQGGGAGGPLTFQRTLPVMVGCWRWEVSNSQEAIFPCREPE